MPRFAATLSTLALLIASPALAQQAPAPGPTQLEQSGLTPPTVLTEGYAARGQDTLVTQLLGQTVYSSVSDTAETIGDITDMVVTSGQGISAVVIGVGGFLGVGEKDVAIDFAQLEWLERPDGSRRWVLAADAEDLRAAPAFIWGESEAATGEPALTNQEEQDQLVDGNPNATPLDPTLTTDQPERPVINTPLDRSGFSDFDEASLTPDQLVGIPVYGLNDVQIGSIASVIQTPQGNLDAVIVDVGGFLGLGAKPVAVGFENLTFSSDTGGNRYLFINATPDLLEAQPAYDPATYEADREQQRMVITP